MYTLVGSLVDGEGVYVRDEWTMTYVDWDIVIS